MNFRSMKENLQNSVVELGQPTRIAVRCGQCGDGGMVNARLVARREVETNPAFAEFRAYSDGATPTCEHHGTTPTCEHHTSTTPTCEHHASTTPTCEHHTQPYRRPSRASRGSKASRRRKSSNCLSAGSQVRVVSKSLRGPPHYFVFFCASSNCHFVKIT